MEDKGQDLNLRPTYRVVNLTQTGLMARLLYLAELPLPKMGRR